MNKKYDIIIIGSGLGSLVCGAILSKEGYSVALFEKHHKIGGCLQTFKRNGIEFDTGVHYVGGLQEGQNLYQYFKYLGIIKKLKTKKLNPESFDIINYERKDYSFAIGYENFKRSLIDQFPNEKSDILNYTDSISKICKVFPLYNLEAGGNYEEKRSFIEKSASGFLDELIKDKTLQHVLSGNSFLYAGQKGITPLYIHALLMNSFIGSSHRFIGGSEQIAYLLANVIKKNGGHIVTNSEVKEIIVENRKAEGIITVNDNKFFGKNIISGIHPTQTINLTPDDAFKKIYRKRIQTLTNTPSVFGVYIKLKENGFPYLNQNYYKHRGSDTWYNKDYNVNNWPSSVMFMTPVHTGFEKNAKSAVILSYMDYDEVKKWKSTTISNRGKDYESFKVDRAYRMINMVEERFAGFKSVIDKYYTSTPLTYLDYTGTPEGSMYGIIRDASNPLETRIPAKTKIPNLFLTGQSTNLHGVLGVTIGSIITCSEFLGMEYLLKKVRNA